MTFLPDDRLLVADNATQTMSLVTKAGAITPVTGLPKVNGLYDVALSPRYASTGFIYFTFAEPTLPGVTPIPTPDTSGVTGTLSLAVGRLVETADGAKLDRIQ